jgi:hypothetical protein
MKTKIPEIVNEATQVQGLLQDPSVAKVKHQKNYTSRI